MNKKQDIYEKIIFFFLKSQNFPKMVIWQVLLFFVYYSLDYILTYKQLTNMNLTVSANANTLPQHAPFLDQQEIIRVGGRLNQSALSADVKHLMLLPKTA